jgi:hypothetical protein
VVPVFPLAGVILLPRSTLPLNVFEPRYLEMVDDALAGNRIICVIQPEGASTDDESPLGKAVPLRKIGSFGRITAYSESDDGRYLITLTGITRLEITDEISSDKPYRVCQVDANRFAADLDRGEGEAEVDRERLLAVLQSYLQAHDLAADWDSIARSSNELLVNTLSVISPYGPEEKQALLEAPDLKARAEVLVALAEMDLASPDDGSGTSVQ